MYPDQNQNQNQPGQQPLQPGQIPAQTAPNPLPQNPYAPPQVSGPVVNGQYGAQPPLAGPIAGKSKKPNPLLIIGVGVVVLLIVSIILAIAVGGGSSKKAVTTNKVPAASTAQLPVAATADSVQQTNDAISQNISSINDTAEFPADALSDSKLNLN